MPETVELYGVTWEKHFATWCAFCPLGEEVEAEWFPQQQNLHVAFSGGTVSLKCPTLDRAAMIVALLARPDAQFELVEWKPMAKMPDELRQGRKDMMLKRCSPNRIEIRYWEPSDSRWWANDSKELLPDDAFSHFALMPEGPKVSDEA